MNWLKNLFKKCEHDYKFVHNIYGDEINYLNGNRSEWKCKKCGNLQWRESLYSKIKYYYDINNNKNCINHFND